MIKFNQSKSFFGINLLLSGYKNPNVLSYNSESNYVFVLQLSIFLIFSFYHFSNSTLVPWVHTVLTIIYLILIFQQFLFLFVNYERKFLVHLVKLIAVLKLENHVYNFVICASFSLLGQTFCL